MRTRLRLLALYLAYWVGFFLTVRGAFLLFFHREARVLGWTVLAGTFRHGVRLDLSAVAYLSLIPFILIALSALVRATRWIGRALFIYTTAATAILSLLTAADLEIFRNWGRRIDAAVLPYLDHPREIWASAGGGPRLLLLAIWIGLTLLFAGFASRLLRPLVRGLPAAHPASGLPLLFCAALLFVPARGGVQQIPINQSSAYFSTEPFANQAALNVGWNFFDSWIRGLNRRSNPYVAVPADSARAIIAGTVRSAARGETRVLRGDRPNVLLIVWEGFTARSVERLGGLKGVTPEFDSLAASGLLFTRLYAAGDRTEKGLAALLAGAPTIPGASIMMVPSKAANLPSLSRRLGESGYQTAFYYGGELGFANLKSFALNGRFGRIIGKEDFPSSLWNSKWGVHDEVVATQLLQDLSVPKEPFFVTWLTLSSHEPFDVPGPVRVPGDDGESRFLNSLAYTDHVLGDFLRRASRMPWWSHTLVVVVADHSKKLERTDAAVPYKSAESWYHIPMLWTGGALTRRGATVDALASQTDFTPTLLGQLGVPGGQRYRFGHDLLAGPVRPWTFYGFDDGFGLVTEAGSLVWEHAPNRITSSTGRVGPADLLLGRAVLQLSFQDYLDR